MATVPPGTKSGPVATSNVTDFRSVWSEKWCDLQKKTEKVFTQILIVFPVKTRYSQKKKKEKKRSLGFTRWFLSVISMGPLSSSWALCWARWGRRPSWSPWAPGSLSPLPLSRRPWMAMKTIICLSFIVLNNFFANMCLKKNCASPTKSLTARHCKLPMTSFKSG